MENSRHGFAWKCGVLGVEMKTLPVNTSEGRAKPALLARSMPVVGIKDVQEENDDDKRQAYYAGGQGKNGGGRCVQTRHPRAQGRQPQRVRTHSFPARSPSNGRSGQEVLDPREFMKRARDEMGAQSIDAHRAAGGGQAGPSTFTGAGHTLSGEQVQGAPAPKPPTEHSITFYKDGFTVDDGPLRKADDPVNAAFLAAVNKGQMPAELIGEDGDAEGDVHIIDKSGEVHLRPCVRGEGEEGQSSSCDWQWLTVPTRLRRAACRPSFPPPPPFPTLSKPSSPRHSHPRQPPGRIARAPAQAYKPPPVTLKPFSGEGRSMRDESAAAGSSAAATEPQELTLDLAAPTTTLQVRMTDGSRKVVKANHTHTVLQLKQHIATLAPGIAFTLKGGFPPKPLNDDALTLADAKLLNESIVFSPA